MVSSFSGPGCGDSSQSSHAVFPHLRHFLQLFWDYPEAFPGQLRDIICPVCPMPTLGSRPRVTCLEHLPRCYRGTPLPEAGGLTSQPTWRGWEPGLMRPTGQRHLSKAGMKSSRHVQEHGARRLGACFRFITAIMGNIPNKGTAAAGISIKIQNISTSHLSSTEAECVNNQPKNKHQEYESDMKVLYYKRMNKTGALVTKYVVLGYIHLEILRTAPVIRFSQTQTCTRFLPHNVSDFCESSY